MTPIDLWLQALRSGKYTQTFRCLADDAGYCCLGVACELYRDTFGSHILKKETIGSMIYYSGEEAVLPLRVQKWLGLTSNNGDFDRGKKSLSQQNDNGRTFPEIADIIEANLAELMP